MTKARRRLDAELLRRGLAETREAAQLLVLSGQVTVGGAPADKSSRLVAADEPIVVLAPPPPFVSRGGEKLAAALERFGVDGAFDSRGITHAEREPALQLVAAECAAELIERDRRGLIVGAADTKKFAPLVA